MVDLAEALYDHRQQLVAAADKLMALRRLVDSPADLSPGQWFQLYAFTREFAPDLVVELGRGYGNTTTVFTQVANEIGTKVVSVGYDSERGWATRTAPRLEPLVGKDWFDPLIVLEQDILELDFEEVFEDSGRILLWWDAHGDKLARYLLARGFPLLRGRQNLVCVHDVSDARYESVGSGYVRSDNLPTFWLGQLVSPFEEIMPIYDFLSRNRIDYQTALGALHAFREQEPEEWSALKSTFAHADLDGATSDGGWMWFTVPEESSIVFPLYSRHDRHHPVFSHFTPWKGEVDAGWDVNWLGVRTRTTYFNQMQCRPDRVAVATQLPPFDSEYFEWIDLLEAVVNARDRFTIIELGAGWGRWLANAAAAVAQYSAIPYHLVGVEAEPTHFAWMRQHLEDNHVDPPSIELLEAAAAGGDGWVRFWVGSPEAWYGQAIAEVDRKKAMRIFLATYLRAVLERRTLRVGPPLRKVQAVSLKRLLADLERVDLIHVDVQGSEADVLEPAEATLDRKVRRVHVGTHTPDAEFRLRRLFTNLGWQKQHDYAAFSESETPWGLISFQDGVQGWVNPKL